jgi:antitoxin VapB
MAFHVRDAATDLAVRQLAALKQKSLTDTIREAVEAEYKRECEQRKPPLAERLRPIQQWVAAHSRPGGLPADKAFYDELSGEF